MESCKESRFITSSRLQETELVGINFCMFQTSPALTHLTLGPSSGFDFTGLDEAVPALTVLKLMDYARDDPLRRAGNLPGLTNLVCCCPKVLSRLCGENVPNLANLELRSYEEEDSIDLNLLPKIKRSLLKKVVHLTLRGTIGSPQAVLARAGNASLVSVRGKNSYLESHRAWSAMPELEERGFTLDANECYGA